MEVLFIIIAFLVISLMLAFKRPLYQAILAGIFTMIVLYRIPIQDSLQQFTKVITSWNSMQILISIYLITFLQRMLEKRQQIKLAQVDLENLFHSTRITCAGASLFIGLLPSAAAMVLCGQIIDEQTKDYLNPKDQAFLASWFRHIPESCLPTYASVLLMCNLSGVKITSFLVGMIIPVIMLILIGYVSILRKVPKTKHTKQKMNFKDILSLFKHLYSLLFILIFIIVFKMNVVEAILLVIMMSLFIYHFTWKEIQPFFLSAFEKKMLGNTFLVLVFKEFVGYSGVLKILPDMLSHLPIPTYLIFVLLFLIGGIISGSSGIIALGTPIAFATLPGGMPLMVLLMCVCHSASQLSPTHICLSVISDYFHISLGDLIKETIPRCLFFILFAIFYYQILLFI